MILIEELLKYLELPQTTTELHVHWHRGKTPVVEAKYQLSLSKVPTPYQDFELGLRGNGVQFTDTLDDVGGGR